MDIEEELDSYECPVLPKRAKLQEKVSSEVGAGPNDRANAKTDPEIDQGDMMETEEELEDLSHELLDSPIKVRKNEGFGAEVEAGAAASAGTGAGAEAGSSVEAGAGGNTETGPKTEVEAEPYDSDDDQPFHVLRLHAVAPRYPTGRNGVQINLPDPQEVLDRIDPELIEDGKPLMIRGHHPDVDVIIIPV